MRWLWRSFIKHEVCVLSLQSLFLASAGWGGGDDDGGCRLPLLLCRPLFLSHICFPLVGRIQLTDSSAHHHGYPRKRNARERERRKKLGLLRLSGQQFRHVSMSLPTRPKQVSLSPIAILASIPTRFTLTLKKAGHIVIVVGPVVMFCLSKWSMAQRASYLITPASITVSLTSVIFITFRFRAAVLVSRKCAKQTSKMSVAANSLSWIRHCKLYTSVFTYWRLLRGNSNFFVARGPSSGGTSSLPS